ncbi:MAG: histidine--tRNA ligase [Candidatus Saccharibacteria bacterium]|nr:histidine--tRNA ligase [Candidatus Saccharibacteria bacterium]
MKKINTSPISGAQELLPEAAATFEKLKAGISEIYHKHGFLKIETPIIDRCEILLAKAGGDTEKQIYKVSKTAEASDSADQALRFDHTVPLARYVVEHENNLTFPFKVCQIGRNFRGERAQKGRFREFYQCDADIIGRNNLPLAYDADIISTLLDAYASLGINTPVLARINNRNIVNGLLEAFNLEEKSGAIFNIIDHAEKVTLEVTKQSLEEEGLESDIVKKLLAFIEIHGDRKKAISDLKNLNIENRTFNLGLSELDTVLDLLEKDGRSGSFEADMKIVRGLDYYTGTVFEFNLPEYKKIGSVGGGGRYENLAGYFTDQKLPGVGGSIGLTRLFYVLNENNLLKSQTEKPLDYAIIPISENEFEFALKVARDLRADNKSATTVLTDKKLGDKLKYAASVAKYGIVLGENEVRTNNFEIKEFN